jgi:hypothetical protein
MNEWRTKHETDNRIDLLGFILRRLGLGEYEMVLRLGSMPILFAAASVLSALLVALLRAPEGYERPDGFHVRARNRRFGHIRRVRLFQPARARGWR